ncbi:hypothetical protein HYH03_004175 [Edaphochlamys debaryana]|uniref:Amine oxidase n=1 Tax=Edaphochlamys debaryana TaxID=47281 RepID=A0A835Y7W8_9CHLO|nr:hypothetical protein HYH03_004175 [Edaphochlamys debaryana]|eukprot:KAG2497910.1 hypothetical protein HYH03_004175 [Edaphochlamys debaryana]
MERALAQARPTVAKLVLPRQGLGVWPAPQLGRRTASSAAPRGDRVVAAANATALVVGGGFSGLAAAKVLCDSGVDVLLVDQGRMLGGRMCSRIATLPDTNERVSFDYGCQYLTARSPQFTAVLDRLRADNATAVWGAGGSVGTAQLAADGGVDMATYKADDKKELIVGLPHNAAVGRALASLAGPRLTTLSATRVEELTWDGARSNWRCTVRTGEAGRSHSGAEVATVNRLKSASFDMVISAMSAVSTARLLGCSRGAGGGVLAPEAVAAASDIAANCCWSVMVALRRKIDLPFDGALLSKPAPGPDGLPQYGPISWLARDSSKPGRHPVGGGEGEAWVIQGGPSWSNAHRDASPEEAAKLLLAEFSKLAQVPIGPQDVLHLEAFRWNNAYALNPRPPTPPQLSSAPKVPLEGHFMLRPELRFAACGEWCKGPRAGDAYMTGWEAAHALLQL